VKKKGGWSAIRRHWAILWRAAAGVMTVVAAIVTPPPTAAGTKGIRPFATFVVAVIIGAILLNYFWYANLSDSLTVDWHDHTFVQGSQLRPEVQKVYGSNISKPIVKKLIADAAGDPSLIWTDESIDSMKNLLCISYLAIVQLIAGCIIAIAQATICSTQSPDPAEPVTTKRKKIALQPPQSP
jgi:hypothetical protein